ncbi:MAG TPA: sensor domain-containing diguanylate cyclase [Spirochaetota bacterium]|nr:sensor domain-containing diguanylate cyclase [Spirochaetota bacterium]HPI90153.1 sensor domain-containing diguanylate cyclase [Spirochaetota bacterium]HPR48912.1 sensor domain-containing diguanylate cyclase [Spirochaetota bacterium]
MTVYDKGMSTVRRLYANIGKLITSSLDLDSILQGIMEEIKIFFGPENWSLMRLDENTNQLFFLIYEGKSPEYMSQIRLNTGEGIAGTVVQTKKPIFVPDTSKEPRFSGKADQLSGFKTRSIIAVPIIFRNQIYGVIELINRHEEHFNEEECLILQTIADFTAIAFANNHLYEQVVSLSVTDPLTGLYNQKMLHDLIDKWAQGPVNDRRSSDFEHETVILYLDLNNFKAINDTFGHREGDRALKEISAALRSVFRHKDLFFRVGGDEFLAIIDLDTNKKEDALRRITGDLENFSWNNNSKGLTVSLAIGISSGPRKNIEELITTADARMYNDKEKKKRN